ncbi:hypothetical protein GE21DRAFT_1185086, partial [Neurospora crassa]
LNNSYSDPIKSSPHELLFGFKLSNPVDLLVGQPNDLRELRPLQDFLRQDAQLAIDFAATTVKRRYDARHQMQEFQKGDKVYLRLHHGY